MWMELLLNRSPSYISPLEAGVQPAGTPMRKNPSV